MAPGPSAGWNGRGFGGTSRRYDFNRGAQAHRSAPLSFANNRAFTGERQRFSVSPIEHGAQITANPDEKVTVGVDADGQVTVDITTPAPENGAPPANGHPQPNEQAQRDAARRQRMQVSANPDGSILVEPEPGSELIGFGEPQSEGVPYFQIIEIVESNT